MPRIELIVAMKDEIMAQKLGIGFAGLLESRNKVYAQICGSLQTDPRFLRQYCGMVHIKRWD